MSQCSRVQSAECTLLSPCCQPTSVCPPACLGSELQLRQSLNIVQVSHPPHRTAPHRTAPRRTPPHPTAPLFVGGWVGGWEGGWLAHESGLHSGLHHQNVLLAYCSAIPYLTRPYPNYPNLP